ncbi:MAG: AraC family transcriptional regulator [Eubacteriales bacterium]|nr:AraC family transcriptional regulator [Eubacteriales bacterium]
MRYSISVTKRQYAKTPLLLRSLGIDHVQDPIYRPAGFPVWQLFYGVSGSGEFLLDGGRGILRPGQAALLAAGEPHSYHSLGGEWVMHYVGFEGKLCQKLMVGLGLGQSGLYSLAQPEVLLGHIKALERIQLEAHTDASLFSSKELYSLLLDFSQSLTPLPDSRYTEATGIEKEMILFLEDHYGEDISLDDLAAQFRRTPEYLCSIFKAATGETILHYLRRVRIHRAKVLLMDQPDAPLREIAEACGFRSLSYFGKVFREATGFTPQGYRLGAAAEPGRF